MLFCFSFGGTLGYERKYQMGQGFHKLSSLGGLMALLWLSFAPNVSAKIYDFDEGIEALTRGLVSENVV
jgi:hypothetical protein